LSTKGPADGEQQITLEVWVELAAKAGHEAVALRQDAILNRKDFLSEFALRALGLADLALKSDLCSKVGAFAGLVVQFAEAFLNVVERFLGGGDLIVSPPVERGDFGFGEPGVADGDGGN
jgi:hypothetical protein